MFFPKQFRLFYVVLGCQVPYFSHQSGPDRVEDGAEWTATCDDGFGVFTEVSVRKCVDNKLSPDLESTPVSCSEGFG